MASVGWSANPYLALVNPKARYQGPSQMDQAAWGGFQQEQPSPQVQPQPQPTGFNAISSAPQEQDSNGLGYGGIGPEVSGPLTSLEASQARDITGFPGAQVAGALMGDEPGFGKSMTQGVTNFGVNLGAQAMGAPIGPARAPVGFMGLMANVLSNPALRSLLGWGMERNIMSPSAAEMQGAVDRYGYGMPSPLGETPSGIPGGVDMGVTQGQLAGVNQAPGDERDSNNGGNGASTGGESAGGSGMGGAGGVGGGGEAKGGVHRTKPGFDRLSQYGEAGPEEAIFIPQRGAKFDMTKPGFQGNEKKVRKALSSNLKKLKG